MGKPVVLTIGGTRPEVLKLAPVVRLLRQERSPVGTLTCFSGQHQELLQSVLGDLDVEPDVHLPELPRQRNLSQSLALLLEGLDAALRSTRPDGVIVQGDTHTALAGAMVAFNNQIPCFHVEAGLRTKTPDLPFPEEMNRRLIGRLASLHFAPTERARRNLLGEGVAENNVFMTGNTVVDALKIYGDIASTTAQEILGQCRPDTRKILVTLHRRENINTIGQVTRAIRHLVMGRDDIEVLWLLHLNASRALVQADLSGQPSVHLLDPQAYRAFVQLMKASYLILTDSGGVQEEAPVLGRPVLVLRGDTERPEAVEAGCAAVIGCRSQAITQACRRLLDEEEAYSSMSQPCSPFGDGHASERIVEEIGRYLLGAERARAVGP